MTGELLGRGDRGEAVEELQDLMNRVGAMLDPDGIFGGGTEAALKRIQEDAQLQPTGRADQQTWAWLSAQPPPSPDIATEAVNFIVREEVGGRDYYERHAKSPHFPGASSGVTIGIGYDLRFQSAADFEAHWSDQLMPDQMAALRPYLGQAGSAAAVTALSNIEVPWLAAWRVFVGRLLPHYVGLARGAFDGFDGLSLLRRGVLVSLVYNRGAGMDGDSRAEMRNIRDHVRNGQLDAVADDLRAMKRLWPTAKGLRDRRDREAELWTKTA